ncbi:Glutamyl-tRNA(Gln) amidotransferase subunit A, chloroplastic/mitochondrial [Sesamum angolense]|uniref:Glutamyl-tRNA(Gln) amidotransferase subunit A, chloroplastic/mitochondrial n=1 Tax=Sesamum angolense TaxID=2727404 RepID=A0AAE1WKD1_9LAMI|nr:Glutamyl-tRNA(Gln) amidotransferase subunit A, chloroplastic/mitochondrial [Sesamum angolense]
MLSSAQTPRLLRSPTTTLKCLHSSPVPASSTAPPPPSQILTTRKSLLSRQTSTVDLAKSFLDRLRRTEPHLNSFLHVSPDEAILKQAEELDNKIKNNEAVGPLAGVLVGVKDNICTYDMPSTAGSRLLENYRPPFDATAVRKLRESGAIVVGKTNLDEFGMGSTTEGSGYQVTANPWDLSRVPGGSSGGSAAAVSARQCMVALGSDTGGSVRQPASFCGVVGLKPTYGRVSRYGLVAYASSLDVIGCFGSSVADAGILLNSISGHDKFDATSSKREVPDYQSQFVAIDYLESKPLKGLRVGVIRETLENGVDSEVISSARDAVSHLEELGCTVTEVSLPSFSLGLPAYYILALSESSSNLSRYDGVRYGKQVPGDELNSLYGDSRAQGFGSEVKMRILMGTYALSAGYYDACYKRAQQVRTIIRSSFKEALDKNDILISPAAPSVAYKIGEKKNDPLAMYAGDIMTVNVNLAGLPALVLPCGFVEGGSGSLPVGFQMIGAAFDEGRDLSPVTDKLWKKFYKLQFGADSTNTVVERMKLRKVTFKWRQLYEAKVKEREEATQKSLDRIKQRYQEEDAKRKDIELRDFQMKSHLNSHYNHVKGWLWKTKSTSAILFKGSPPSKKRSFYGGVAASNIYNTKSGLLKKAKLEFINSREVKNIAAMKNKVVHRNHSVSSTRKPIVNSGFAASSSSSSSSKITKPIQRRF